MFSYTGTLDLNKAEALFYILGTKGDWSLADKQIDRVAKTITFKDIDLSHGDATIMLESKDAAGNTLRLVQQISGPFTTFTAKAADDGIVLRANKDGNVYLVDGDDVVQVATGAKSGGALAGVDVKLGVQQTAVQGILGVGPSATVHSDHAGITYGLGTDGADTLAGNYVWAYDGDDTIQAVGSAANDASHQLSVVYGGKGADTIAAGAGGSWFLYRSAEESTVVADDMAAHGFDTVVFGTGATDVAHTQVFDFAVQLDGIYMPIASEKSLTGTETGNELLALLNAALVQKSTITFPGHGKVSGTFIDFAVAGGGHENFLVVDADGNGTIDGADYVIKLIGTIDAAGSVYIDKTGTISFHSA
ncbi:hypothetical protein [uncultured Massilia sp.]|uniref:hypothetical protein n=1 Tax=uncultured Massilia sp. TaxID=169973 RepID=UPI0025F94355|nr:hypothetical protein [uncultured Massilia sp.]